MFKIKSRNIILFLALAGMNALPFPIRGQDEAPRKSRKEPKPDYPPLARKMHITGTVKIEVTINPDGKVKTTRVVGGHPLLAQAAEQAAKQWEFDAGSKLSSQMIDFKFDDAKN